MKDRFTDMDWKPASLKEVSVMVVDDEILITRLVAGSLKTFGITKIYTTTNPHQALDFIAEGLGGTDLIVCDLMMPEVDGLTILKEARKVKPDIPFLMLTGDGTSDSVKRAKELGVSSYMIKPFSAKDLETRLRQLIVRSYGPEAAAST